MIETCKNDGCSTRAYHLSTVGGHFFGHPGQDGRCMWAETRKYRCLAGHISEQSIWKVRNMLASGTSQEDDKS
jgi:hypothetical protein